MMEEMLEQLLEECRPYTQQGSVATYIPELAKGDRNDLGLYVLRSDGRHFQAGDYKKRFTFQSVVKPILLHNPLHTLRYWAELPFRFCGNRNGK